MIRFSINNVPFYRFEIFEKYQNISNYCSTRNGGVSKNYFENFNLGFTVNDEINSVIKNRKILANCLDVATDNMIYAKQSSEDRIAIVEQKHLNYKIGEIHPDLTGIDALITNQTNLFLSVLTADCVPILLYDYKNKVIAVVHAGWRGTALRIAEKTIQKMQSLFNSNPENIIAGLGPSISTNKYEIGNDVIEIFMSNFNYYFEFIKEMPNNKFLLDLWKANKLQLTRCGMKDENIQISNLCTYSIPEDFFSARYNNSITGRLSSGIMIVKT